MRASLTRYQAAGTAERAICTSRHVKAGGGGVRLLDAMRVESRADSQTANRKPVGSHAAPLEQAVACRSRCDWQERVATSRAAIKRLHWLDRFAGTMRGYTRTSPRPSTPSLLHLPHAYTQPCRASTVASRYQHYYPPPTTIIITPMHKRHGCCRARKRVQSRHLARPVR